MNPIGPPSEPPTVTSLRGLFCAAGLYTFLMAAALPGFGYWGWSRHHLNGVWIALAAAFICWLGGVGALFAVSMGCKSQSVVNAVLIGIIFRLAMPLIAMVFSSNVVRGDIGRSLSGMVVGYYLLGLAIETPLLLRFVNASSPRRDASGPPARATKVS